MQGRYRGRYVIAPQSLSSAKEPRRPWTLPPVGAFSFWSSVFYRDPRWRNWWSARRSSSPRRISNAASLTFLAQPSPRSLSMVRPSVEMGATSSPMWCASQFGEGLDELQ